MSGRSIDQFTPYNGPRLMTVELKATAVANEFIPVLTYSSAQELSGKQMVRGSASSLTISHQPRATLFDFTKFQLDWYGTLLQCSLTAQPQDNSDADAAFDPEGADLVLIFRAEREQLANNGELSLRLLSANCSQNVLAVLLWLL
jgi:hypothetical protein